MRGLRKLGLGDLLALVGGVAVGNAITLALFALLGLSEVPAEAGLLGLLGSFLAVLVGLTVVPVALIVSLAYLSARLA